MDITGKNYVFITSRSWLNASTLCCVGNFKVLLSPVKGFSPYSVFEAHKSFPFGEERHLTSGVTSTSNKQQCLLTNERLTIFISTSNINQLLCYSGIHLS